MAHLNWHNVPDVTGFNYNPEAEMFQIHLGNVGSAVMNPIHLRLEGMFTHSINPFVLLAQMRAAVDEAIQHQLDKLED